MRVVDDALLGAIGDGTDNPLRLALGGIIGGDPHLPVWDGETGIDPMLAEAVVIDYPVPFATYASSVGDDDNRRLSGRKTRRSVFIVLIYVGQDRTQCKWAGERLRRRLQRRRLEIEDYKLWPIDLQESQRVRRDDNVMRPDGSPLWYGIDNYAVSLSLTQKEVTIP